MQFSLKWILAAMAYVALAAAAFSRQTWMFADLLWVVSLLAIVFAVLLTCFARERRQVGAAGFVVASACYLLCLNIGSDTVPTQRLLAAAGISGNAPPAVPYSAPQQMALKRQRPVTVTTNTATGPGETVKMVSESVVMPSPAVPATASAATYYAPIPAPRAMATFMNNGPVTIHLFRAANAVGMMLFGGLGVLVGLLAYKSARRTTTSP
jgi:hypothetical protein